ncbi:hypothetical protein PENNAL_c0287G09883, partial [Penicillium nalgiovense]
MSAGSAHQDRATQASLFDMVHWQMLSWFTAIYFATLPAKLGRRKLFLWFLSAIWLPGSVFSNTFGEMLTYLTIYES